MKIGQKTEFMFHVGAFVEYVYLHYQWVSIVLKNMLHLLFLAKVLNTHHINHIFTKCFPC